MTKGVNSILRFIVGGRRFETARAYQIKIPYFKLFFPIILIALSTNMISPLSLISYFFIPVSMFVPIYHNRLILLDSTILQ